MSRTNENGAVQSLERLGLSNYEARVFIALQRLGSGTAKDVHDLADVPRSQVYGAAESLEDRGLLEVQQSTPKRYRPVSLDEARERLTRALERETESAFAYLEEVRREQRGAERRDDVWTVRGVGPVTSRVVELAGEAESFVLYGAAEPTLVTDELVQVLNEQADAGVQVLVLSENAAVREPFEGTGVRATAPVNDPPQEFPGRVLIVDDRTILLSVLPAEDPSEEMGLWSADTAMADVLVRIVYNAAEAMLEE